MNAITIMSKIRITNIRLVPFLISGVSKQS